MYSLYFCLVIFLKRSVHVLYCSIFAFEWNRKKGILCRYDFRLDWLWLSNLSAIHIMINKSSNNTKTHSSSKVALLLVFGLYYSLKPAAGCLLYTRTVALIYGLSVYALYFNSGQSKGQGGSMSEVVGFPNNSYKPITNTAWVRTRLCKLQKRCTRLDLQVIKLHVVYLIHPL